MSLAHAYAGAGYPYAPHALPPHRVQAGRYEMRFARSRDELERVLRLRFEVFNKEMGEGLDEAWRTGLDEDGLEEQFHHLIIAESASGRPVGTYRLQTGEMAAAGAGFYSAGEFAVDQLPPAMLGAAVEVGRACVDRAHRNGRVLQLLWRGLAAYLSWNRKSLLFGCCSLTGDDEASALALHAWLEDAGHLHKEWHAPPLPGLECRGSAAPRPPALPPLFGGYLALGAKALGRPAVDRLFKTIDWLVVLDTDTLDDRTRRTFFR
ncbi:MAG TPA: GNAT family N-acyltransferase [Gemmatimonadales bacterium]|nr:GNAT family N-acyltransferase [Gemmatimonadales bacterium]